jgi:hypothetical protein
MRNALDTAVAFATHHDPVVTAGLALIALLIVPLGTVHALRVFGDIVLVVIRELKREAHELKDVIDKIVREMMPGRRDAPKNVP